MERAVFAKTTNSISPDSIKYYFYDADGGRKDRHRPDSEEWRKSEKERYLLCSQCGNKISRPEYRVSNLGAFEHTFLNPEGQVFHIGCFRRADGCIVLEESSSEWTWFQGFEWRGALCRQCLKHLGWYYQSPDASPFFGLILDTLV